MTEHDVHVVTGHDQAGDAVHVVDRDGDGDARPVPIAIWSTGRALVERYEADRPCRVGEHAVDQHLVGGEVVHRDLVADRSLRS